MHLNPNIMPRAHTRITILTIFVLPKLKIIGVTIDSNKVYAKIYTPKTTDFESRIPSIFD